MNSLQLLHDSEINAGISCFYDGGFTATIGDEQNGIITRATCETEKQAENFLLKKAVEHFPQSKLMRCPKCGELLIAEGDTHQMTVFISCPNLCEVKLDSDLESVLFEHFSREFQETFVN